MESITSTVTFDKKLNLVQSVLGCSKENICTQSSEVSSMFTHLYIKEGEDTKNVIEVRFDDSTLSCYFEEEVLCDKSFLFPDTEEEIDRYIEYCNTHYIPFNNQIWLNHKDNITIRIMNDCELGSIISCRKVKKAN